MLGPGALIGMVLLLLLFIFLGTTDTINTLLFCYHGIFQSAVNSANVWIATGSWRQQSQKVHASPKLDEPTTDCNPKPQVLFI